MGKIYEILGDNRPNIKWNKEKHINSGWDYRVILLDNKYVIRIPKNDDAKERVDVDFCLLKNLNKIKGFHIPKPIYLNKKNQVAVYVAVKGDEMSVSRYKKMTDVQKIKFIKSISVFLKSLHKTPINKVCRDKLPITNIETINKTIYKDVNIIKPKLNKKQRGTLDDFIDYRKSVIRNTDLVLIHGDLNSENILLNNSIIGVIDFSDAAISDAAIDFSSLLCYGTDFVTKVIEYYGVENNESLLTKAKIYYKDVAIKVLATAIRGSKEISVKDAKKFFDSRIK